MNQERMKEKIYKIRGQSVKCQRKIKEANRQNILMGFGNVWKW